MKIKETKQHKYCAENLIYYSQNQSPIQPIDSVTGTISSSGTGPGIVDGLQCIKRIIYSNRVQ